MERKIVNTIMNIHKSFQLHSTIMYTLPNVRVNVTQPSLPNTICTDRTKDQISLQYRKIQTVNENIFAIATKYSSTDNCTHHRPISDDSVRRRLITNNNNISPFGRGSCIYVTIENVDGVSGLRNQLYIYN